MTLVGSDSTLGIAFVYNADNEDGGGEGYGSPVPAVGFHLFQGPEVPTDGLDNDKDGRIDEVGERRQMTNFMNMNDGGGVTESPTVGAHYYTYMQSLWKDGKPMTFGGIGRNFSEIPAKYFFPGDPVTREFWSELNSDSLGTPIGPGDRRFMFSSGPFDLEPGESTEIVFSIIWALGADHLNSISKMREAAAEVRSAYENGFKNLPRGLRPSEPVTLISPGDGAAGQPLSPVLIWNSLSDAPRYQIEVWSQDTGNLLFASRRQDYQLADLVADRLYTWRVRGENSHGFGPWSKGRTFRTGDVSFRVVNELFSSFTVTANAAGPLVPRDMAAFAFGSSGFHKFLARMTQQLCATDRPGDTNNRRVMRYGVSIRGEQESATAHLARMRVFWVE